MTQICVWYKLVNPDGRAFKGATATRAFVFEDAIVDDLRDSVKAKNADDLVGVYAARLLVYTSDWTPGSDTKVLEVDTPVNGLGKVKENALVVVVPSN